MSYNEDTDTNISKRSLEKQIYDHDGYLGSYTALPYAVLGYYSILNGKIWFNGQPTDQFITGCKI